MIKANEAIISGSTRIDVDEGGSTRGTTTLDDVIIAKEVVAFEIEIANVVLFSLDSLMCRNDLF
jgi:hypothetical protein